VGEELQLRDHPEGDGGPAVAIGPFTGPLDLLLQLIRGNELSIYDIPIASICDQYHEVLAAMQVLDLDIAGEFVWMAAWLLDLKARTLLPSTPRGGDDGDPRMELVERLLEYRRGKEVAAALYDTDVVRRCLWQPEVGAGALGGEPELDWEDVDLRMLARSYLEVMERFAASHPPPLQVAPLRFRVEDTMRSLYDRVHEGQLLPLLRVIDATPDADEVVALVVATLELVRIGGLRAEQRREFAEIYLRPGPRSFGPDETFRVAAKEMNGGA
jgi:segregation and condensation protein A